MTNLVQKEIAKRHESPRSRRQIVSNAYNQQPNAASVNKKFNNTMNFGDSNHMSDINSYFVNGQNENKSQSKVGNY